METAGVECSICFETMEPTMSLTLACQHTYHPWCIHGWVNVGKTKSCPLCQNVDAVKKFREAPDTIDASDMVWPCFKCQGGTASSKAVTCEGKSCLLKSSANFCEYAFDARALCYGCANVTDETVASAPAFKCDRCL